MWLYQALSQHVLPQHLRTLSEDQARTAKFYSEYALVRDVPKMTDLLNHADGMGGIHFNLMEAVAPSRYDRRRAADRRRLRRAADGCRGLHAVIPDLGPNPMVFASTQSGLLNAGADVGYSQVRIKNVGQRSFEAKIQ